MFKLYCSFEIFGTYFLLKVLQKLNRRSVSDSFLKMILSWRAEKDAFKEKVLSFQKQGQKRKLVIKIEFTPLPFCNILPFF